MQLTNYRFLNNQQAVLFTNNNSACFAEITNNENGKFDLYFQKENTMEVFFRIEDMLCSKELVTFWIKELNKFGFKIKLNTIDIKKKSKEYPRCIRTGLNYVFTFKIKNYDSKAKLKFAFHLVRNIYENNLYKNVLLAFNYKTKYNQYNILEIFMFISMFNTDYFNGHRLFYSGICYKIFTKKEFNIIFNKWAKTKYNNHELNQLTKKEKTIYLSKLPITIEDKISTYRKLYN